MILAVSQRSFLSLKRIETYLLSATNDQVNHLLILHIHKLLTETLNLTKVVNDFVEEDNKENQNLDFDNVRPYLL